MNSLIRLAASFFLAFTAAPFSFAAEPRASADPATLFPPSTLAYVELHDPATVAPRLRAAFKGTVLEDSIAFIQNRWEKSKEPRDHFGKDELAVLGLLASPEMAGELKKVRGIALGIVGLTPNQEPDAALAVLTGDSPAVGLLARALLTMSSFRKVGTVGDVPVYQIRRPRFVYLNGRQTLQDVKPSEGSREATLAYLPGLFVVGTSKPAVGEIVKRFQGKVKGSLASNPMFQEAAKVHRQPGLFFFANVPEFCDKFAQAQEKEGAGTLEPALLGWFKVLVSAKSLRYAAGCVKLGTGGPVLSLGGAFDPSKKSPLFEALSGPATQAQWLRHAPAPATFAFAVAFPEKNRAAAVVNWLDAMAKASGELGRMPSEAIKELDAKYKVNIAAELIGKTAGATVVLPTNQDVPKGAVKMPILVLHAESPAVAEAWQAFLPRLIGDLARSEPPQPATETIDGLKVISLPGSGLPWKAAVHSARKGTIFAVGLDRKLVVAAVHGLANGSAAAIPEGKAPVLVGSIGLGGMIRFITEEKKATGPVVPVGPVRPAKTTRQGFGRRGFEGIGPGGSSASLTGNQKTEEAKAWTTLLAALDGLPPVAFAARRTGAQIQIEFRPMKATTNGLAPFVNAAVDFYDKLLNHQSNPNGYNSSPYNWIR